jgi:Cu+-exporting ATPase
MSAQGAGCGCTDHHHGAGTVASCCSSGAVREADGRDPVCGMSVDPTTAKHRTEYNGQSYVFCCAGCRTKFEADPIRYLEPASAAAPEPMPAGTMFTCPMDPEIRQEGPGSCPICGMALEPETVTLDDGPNAELVDFTRRFWIGLALTLPVFLVEMGAHLFGLHLLAQGPSNWLQLVLATPVVLWAGWPFLVRGWRSVLSGHLNMFTLVALGTGVAWLYSVAATAAPRLFPAAARGPDGAVPAYFESAAMITVLVLLGQMLELRARAGTNGAIRALLGLAPAQARRIDRHGVEADVALDAVEVGDRLRVRPGDKVPVDGTVLEGRSALDESMVTGESMPVAKAAGSRLIGGTLNGEGTLVMRADAVGRDTMLARIVQRVAEAQRSRAPIQRLADRVSGYFVPAVLACAVLAFGAWFVLGPEPRLSSALLAAIAVVIIACPCALGLATPMSIMVGIGRGAAAGILVRDAAALEAMERVDTIVIDKTGTLTEGRPRVTAIVPAPGFNEAEILRLAASLERGSAHPLAAAILGAAEARGLALAPVGAFDNPGGKGARGEVEGRAVAVGSALFLNELGVATDALAARADDLRREGETAMLVAIDGRLAGAVAVADTIKPSARAALDALRNEGLRIVMLTGDNRITAEAVARRLGIAEVQAETPPTGKGEAVARLRAEGRVVAMVGDGVNDAPALAGADLGIAMGSGSDAAIESASVTLLRGDLNGLIEARRLSRAVMANIRQNLVFAFIYNVAGVPIAAGVLYPVFGLLLSPVIAAAAMSLSSVSVIGNALRLRAMRL